VARICSIERIPRRIEIEADSGIRVAEVRTIQEAMGYFFG
jgi:hypothetical protein